MLVFAATLLLNSCGNASVQTAEFFVFGTIVEVSIAGAEPDVVEQAFAELQTQFQSQHRDWHAWEPGKLTTINDALARGIPAAADEDLAELVRLSQETETLSGGRFNPAIGRLVGLWGFHTSDFPILGPAPDAGAIAALVALNPSTHDINVSDANGVASLSSPNPAVQLDFGGIAKGYAVDLACDSLKARGIGNAIVNAGGDLRAYGSKGSQPWRVAIRNPYSQDADGLPGTVLATIDIHEDESVFTSGNYQRFRKTGDGQRFAHILDPRTGWPAHGIAAATVIGQVGWKADAAATAFVVAGLEDWAEVARGFGMDQVLLADANGGLHATPAMLERLIADDAVKQSIAILRPDD